MKKILAPTLLALTICPKIYANNYDLQINSEKPNIVFILTEDMNPRIGAYGDTIAHTPNLDKLAKESVLFSNAFTLAGVSAPSRAGLITGMPQHANGLHNMRAATFPGGAYHAVPSANIKGYPELLRRNGYFTYVDVKTDYQFSDGAQGVGPFSLWSAHGDPKNFDDFKVPAAWQQHDLKGKPFFLNLNPQITHESGMFTASNYAKGFEGLAKQWDRLRSEYKYTPTNPARIKIDPYWKDTPEVRKELALFYDNIQVMDQQVGNIINKLKEDNLWNNTIVIFAADNGDGLPRHKREGYDSGTHVPLIIHLPEKYRPAGWKKDGEKDDRLVSFEDLAPTILGFSKTQIPDYMKGIDLSKNNAPEREFIFSSRARMDDQQMRSYFVRDKNYQYVRNIDKTPGGAKIEFRNALKTMDALNKGLSDKILTREQEQWFKDRPDEELYDINKDPHELNNIATQKSVAQKISNYRHKLDGNRSPAPA